MKADFITLISFADCLNNVIIYLHQNIAAHV